MGTFVRVETERISKEVVLMRKLILLFVFGLHHVCFALDLYEEVSTESEPSVYDLTIDDFVRARDERVSEQTYGPCQLEQAMNYLEPQSFLQEEVQNIDWEERGNDGEITMFFVEENTDLSEPETIKVMGLTEREALELSNDPNGEACSNKHNQGDVANRWCHTVIVDYVNRGLMKAGVNPIVSHVAASAFFLPKEFLYDKNPSLSDMGAPDITVYNKNHAKVTVTPFADGAVFVTVDKRF